MKLALRKRGGTLADDDKGSWVRSVVILTITLLAAFPLYYILVSAFKSQNQFIEHPLSLPWPLHLDNFSTAFERSNMIRAFLNSLVITAGAVIIQVIVGSMAAFAMIIGNKKLVAAIGLLLTIAFAIPGQATLVPQYRLMARFGLTDSLLGVITVYTVGAIFSYFLIVGYMRTLPAELFEAARIDGAGPFRTYRSIVMPLIRPILVTVVVFQSMSTWNDFLTPNVYLSSEQNRTVVLQVYKAVNQFDTNWPLFMATTVIALLPVFIFFIFCQRFIVSGLTAGAVKG